jgi:hypothetical protein
LRFGGGGVKPSLDAEGASFRYPGRYPKNDGTGGGDDERPVITEFLASGEVAEWLKAAVC